MERFDLEQTKKLYSGNLIKDEIDRNGLPKTALNILHECDPLINHYIETGKAVFTIPLFAKEYKRLAEALKKKNQNISERVYRGFAFRNIEK
jgi:hypothetical protein